MKVKLLKKIRRRWSIYTHMIYDPYIQKYTTYYYIIDNNRWIYNLFHWKGWNPSKRSFQEAKDYIMKKVRDQYGNNKFTKIWYNR